MALLHIGPLQIDVFPLNAHQLDVSGETAFARKAIAGAANNHEHTGEDINDLIVVGRVFPQRIGGLSELEAIEAIRTAGVPQLVVRGDGEVLGWYAIIRLERSDQYLAADGVGRQIDFTARLERTKAPSAQGFFASMLGIIT